MHWNYRAIAVEFSGEIFHQVHEVYYDDRGKPDGVTAKGIVPMSDEGVDGLIEVLEMMLKDVKRAPPIDMKEFDKQAEDVTKRFKE